MNQRDHCLCVQYTGTVTVWTKESMSENGGEESSSPKRKDVSGKPPRPPPRNPSNCPKLSRPPSVQHHLNALQPLKPDRVRWFVKEDKKWVPFNGSDSLAIEHCYLQLLALENRIEDSSKPLNTSSMYEFPTVKGGLYEVDVVARQCTPIYWKGLCYIRVHTRKSIQCSNL